MFQHFLSFALLLPSVYCCIATGTPETPTTTPAICPSGWTYFSTTGYCYLVGGVGLFTFWQDAENDCVAQGGHLVSIHSQAENDFVLMLTTSGQLLGLTDMPWIGLYRTPSIPLPGQTSTLQWSDGTPFDYTNWGIGQPLIGAGGCMQMVSDLLSTGSSYIKEVWFENICATLVAKYVCKRAP